MVDSTTKFLFKIGVQDGEIPKAAYLSGDRPTQMILLQEPIEMKKIGEIVRVNDKKSG